MNIIRMSGGLGNQLFQIAFYLNHIKANKITKFDTTYYNGKKHIRFDEFMKLNLLIASETDLKLFKTKSSSTLIGKILIKVYMVIGLRIIRIFSKRTIHFHQGRFNHYKEYWTEYDWVYFDGTFFNYKMVLNVKTEIYKFINNINVPDYHLADIVGILSENTVAVHVRSGDYKDLKKQGFFVLEKKYYEDALKLVENNIPNPYYLLFSDSNNEVFDLFENRNHLVVNFNSEYTDFYELKIMSRCKNIIMANSSYSLWASYLIEDDSGMIIGPDKWMRQYYANTKDILPKSAISITVNV